MRSSFRTLIYQNAFNMKESNVEREQPRRIHIPVLLLKTKSTPHDGYAEYFGTVESNGVRWSFEPVFVPVLEHRIKEDQLARFNSFLTGKKISNNTDASYGGLIFTSQRAVEAFARLVEDGRGQNDAEKDWDAWPHLQSIPIYTVGPATSRALRSISQNPPLNIFGSETGNGEALADYILDHYSSWYANLPTKPPLLFLVGEQRRDIIPKTLMAATLPLHKQIAVEELVVYETGVMESFEQDFSKLLENTQNHRVKWVVVFSPTGCKVMLRALDMLDVGTGKVKTGERGGGCGNRKGKRKTYIAAIGPTTRDYLRKTFGFEPDVCAEKPSPEGIGEAMEKFMDRSWED